MLDIYDLFWCDTRDLVIWHRQICVFLATLTLNLFFCFVGLLYLSGGLFCWIGRTERENPKLSELRALMTDGLAKQRMPLALALVVMLVGDLAFEGLARSAARWTRV